MSTGFHWNELYAWHDTGTGSGFLSTGGLVEPEQHGESPATKRRLRNLLDVTGLLEQTVGDPRPQGDRGGDPARPHRRVPRADQARKRGGRRRRRRTGALRARRLSRSARSRPAACIATFEAVLRRRRRQRLLAQPPARPPRRARRRPRLLHLRQHRASRSNTRAPSVASSGSRSSTGTSTTATAPSTPSTRTPTC